MKISICIPQYNRIRFLLASLERIKSQTFRNIEICISDDCSTDDTEDRIRELIPLYPFPIVYSRNEKNLGYDANLRNALGLATGEYCFILGNDDSLRTPDDFQYLADFLEKNNYPDVGFCNMTEDGSTEKVFQRATRTAVLGSGMETALNYYSCFSFVGGIIYKKSAFDHYNTDKHDGSIYVQMYLATTIIAAGGRLFSIKEPMVLKDILLQVKESRNIYSDRLPRKWKDFYIIHGGLPSVINVLQSGFRDAGIPKGKVLFRIFNRMYLFTVPNWILDYKSHKAFPAAVGIMVGMFPYRVNHFTSMNIFKQMFLTGLYVFTSLMSLLMPYRLFLRFKNQLYSLAKKS